MTRLHIKSLGMAFGVTAVLLYIGCILVMTFLGQEKSILFFNSLLHGIDVATIIRMDMPISEMFMGLVQTFILGWLTGAVIAAVYNVAAGRKSR